jgi:very-short-patch-repair endonuclease
MLALSPRAYSAAARRHGVLTRAELCRSGLSDGQISRLVRGGALERLLPGVYACSGSAPTELRQLAALCSWSPCVVVSHETAGRLWMLRALARGGIEVSVPHSRRFAANGAIVHRSTDLQPIDIVERDDGIRLTSPIRTVFDLASVLNDKALESVLEQCLHERLISVGSLSSAMSRLAGGGRKGTARFRRVVEARSLWQVAAESGLEVRFIQALRDARLPEPVRQYPMVWPDGRGIRVDLAYPDQRIAIELDGYGHTGPSASARDRRRDALMAQMAWVTLRFPGEQLWPDCSPAVRQVSALLAASPRA